MARIGQWRQNNADEGCDMKRLLLFLVALLVIGANGASAQTVWSEGAYYPDSTGGVPAVSQIPWSYLTHVDMVGGSPNSGGSITYSSDFSNGNATALVTAAHAHSVKALFALSNVGSGTDFNGAITGSCSTGALKTFITNIMSTVNSYGFDGVFVDYEESYSSQFPTFMSCLRTAVGTKLIEWFTGPTYMFGQAGSGGSAVCGLTSNWNVASSVILGIANNADRVTVGAYDINNVYSTSYFGAPLYSANYATYGFTASGEWERQVEAACGIPNSKLTLGIPFFGYVWTGNTAPYQAIGGGAGATGTYYSTMAATYNLNSYTYDSTAHEAWSTQGPGYITWPNAQSITDKINYVYAQGMGGWMLWNVGNDYTSGSMPLLAAVGAAFRGSTAATPTFSPVAGTYSGTQSVTISSTTPSATICYNTTGSPATNGLGTGCTTGTMYSSPVSVSASETLYAVAGTSSLADSSVGSAAYVIGPASPTGFSIKISGATLKGGSTIQ
jgi:GH18 family chitinase